LESSHGEGVSGQTEVGFSLATASGEPEQVGNGIGRVTSVRVMDIVEGGKIQQDEGKLEQAPTPVFRNVESAGPVLRLNFLYEFSGLKSKSLKRRSDQRYAHFSIIGM